MVATLDARTLVRQRSIVVLQTQFHIPCVRCGYTAIVLRVFVVASLDKSPQSNVCTTATEGIKIIVACNLNYRNIVLR